MFDDKNGPDAARAGAFLPRPPAYEVTMPALGKPTATEILSFSLETLSTVVSEKRKLDDLAQKLAQKVAFVAVKQAGGLVANVLISEFFDTALADMLDTLGDTGLGAASRTLREAAAEPPGPVRCRHQQTAEGLLRLAFEGYEGSIAARKAKLFTVTGDKDVALHAKAVAVAVTIAAISQAAGAAATMESWIDSSMQDLAKMGVIIRAERDASVAAYNKRFGKGITVGALFDPYPMDTELRMRHRAERAMACAKKFDADVQRWGRLVRQLKAGI